MSEKNHISPSDFVFKYPFDNPLQRLIMMLILSSGNANGEGERILDNGDLSQFCCCSKQAMFKETQKMQRDGFLVIRKIAGVTTDAKLRIEPVRGYTITPPMETSV